MTEYVLRQLLLLGCFVAVAQACTPSPVPRSDSADEPVHAVTEDGGELGELETPLEQAAEQASLHAAECHEPWTEWNLPQRFVSDEGRAAMLLVQQQQWREAARSFVKLQDDAATGGEEWCSARWMEVYAFERMGDAQRLWERASEATQTCVHLRPYFVLAAAKGLSQSGRYEELLSWAAQLAEDEPTHRELQHLAARALSRLRRFEDLEQRLQSYEQRYGSDLQSVGLRLEAARRQGDDERAAALLAEMIVRWPESWQARVALRQKAPPAATGRAQRELERAREQLERRRSKTASRILSNMFGWVERGSSERCEATLLLARAKVMQRHRGEARLVFDEALEDCAGQESYDGILYHSAENLFQLHDLDKASTLLELLRQRQRSLPPLDTPPPTWSARIPIDEALLLYARIELDRHRQERAKVLLETVLLRHPGDKLGAEAAFLLFWSSYREGDWLEALVSAERSLSLQLEPSVRGRLVFWHARTLQRLGHEEDAAQRYRELIREHPHAYYALVSYSRLSEIVGEEEANAFIAGLRAEAQAQYQCIGDGFDWDSLPPGFAQQAMEFLVLGLYDLFESHMRAASIQEQPDELWLTALMMSRQGEHRRSYLLARAQALEELEVLPAGEREERWALVYPRPYEELVEAALREEPGLSPDLVYGVMRQESGFRADALSSARAYGLMQLLLPTARGLAREDEGKIEVS
ncbi:MAG: transglycosylase SLT domain-containing protein, partial [Myxococcota bacterium]|nr:transglycosylase SLT domain-containing protein [Myxococcota bacterium]